MTSYTRLPVDDDASDYSSSSYEARRPFEINDLRILATQANKSNSPQRNYWPLVYSVVVIMTVMLGVSVIVNDVKHLSSNFEQDKAGYERVEIRDMTEEQLDKYFNALWTYKKTGRQDGRDYMRTYDEFVAQHALATANKTVDQAHTWAAFIPWHSIVVYEVEMALRSIDPTVSIPYWDWTIDADLEYLNDSVILTDAYFGSSLGYENDYTVRDSRMANWAISKEAESLFGWKSEYGYLRSKRSSNSASVVSRHTGSVARNGLPKSDEFYSCLNTEDYDTFANFWPCIWGTAGSNKEGSKLHNGVHVAVGGQWVDVKSKQTVDGDFLDFYTSPNDPLWLSHHANLDRLWYMWKERSGSTKFTDTDPCGGFYDGTDENTQFPQPPGHNLHDTFMPEFYAFRSDDEVSVGTAGITLAESCYYLQRERSPYSYAAAGTEETV